MKKIKNMWWGIVLTFLAVNSAFGADLFTPVTGDKTIEVLGQIFGGLLDSGGGNPLLAGIKTLNGAVLIIGGILASYTLLAGTLGTAHEGEMLGKKFSSVWVPIRYSVGTALVLPVIGGGYCVMQAMVMWVIVQGVGLADMVWGSFVSSENIGKTLSMSMTRPEATQSAFKLYESLACKNFLQAIANTEEGKLFKLGAMAPGMSTDEGDYAIKYSFGFTNANQNECGSVTIKKFTTPETTSPMNIIKFTLGASDAVNRMLKLNQDNLTQYQNLITKLDAIAQREVNASINGGARPSLAEVKKAANEYEEALKQSAAALAMQMDDNSAVQASANQDGFILAGAYQLRLSLIASKIQETIADVPEATGPTSFNNAAWQDQYDKLMSGLIKRYDQYSVAVSTYGVGNIDGGSNQSWWSTIAKTVVNFDPSILAKKAFTSSSKFMLNDGENPMIALKREGNWLLGIASSAQVILMTANSTLGLTPGVAAVISDLSRMFIPPMMLVGGILSYMLPMMPFIIWIGAILGFLVSCLMAVIAAPLWAVAHLHPEGHDLTGKGGNGYMMILSLLLRPVLMVFGLIAGMVLMSGMGDIINRIFGEVFILSQSDSSFLILIVGMLIAAPVIHGAVMWTLIKKCMSLVTYLPDEALRWIGGGESFGHFANDDTGFTAIRAASSAAVFQSATALSGGGKGGNGGSQMSPQEMQQASMKENIANVGAKEDQAQATKNGESFSSMNAQKSREGYMNRTNEAVSSLGGAGSKNAENFLNNVNKLKAQDPDRPISKIMDSALNGELNQKYGAGAGGAIGRMGNGYSGEAFQSAVSTFEKASNALYEQGLKPNEISQAISSSVVEANAAHSNHLEAMKADPSIEPISYTDFVKESLDRTIDSNQK